MRRRQQGGGAAGQHSGGRGAHTELGRQDAVGWWRFSLYPHPPPPPGIKRGKPRVAGVPRQAQPDDAEPAHNGCDAVRGGKIRTWRQQPARPLPPLPGHPPPHSGIGPGCTTAPDWAAQPRGWRGRPRVGGVTVGAHHHPACYGSHLGGGPGPSSLQWGVWRAATRSGEECGRPLW